MYFRWRCSPAPASFPIVLLSLRSRFRRRDLLDALRELPHDGGGGLVLAETEEGRMAHPSIFRPLAEAYLGDQLRLDPVRAADARGRRSEGTRLTLERAQAARELPQRFFRESRPDLPCVDQPAILMDAGEQRPQPHARTLRIGVAADHHFLTLEAFDLEPLAASCAAIGRVPQLGHDALEAVPAGLGEEGGAVTHHVIAVAERTGCVTHRPEHIGEETFAVFQARPRHIAPVQVEKIEDEVRELTRGQSREMVLQRLEARGAVVQQHGNLAVEQSIFDVEALQGLRDGGEVVGPVTPVPAQQAHPTVPDAGEDAVAVVLHLVEPGLTLGRAVDQGRQLRGDELRQSRLARAGDLVRVSAARTAAATHRARPRRPRLGRNRLASVPVRMPDAALGGGDLIEGAPRAHALGSGIHDAGAVARARRFVPLLDEEPAPPLVVAALASPDPHECPSAVELLALEGELEIALAVALVRIAHGFPCAAVPHHHGATAVLALRDGSLEAAVLERMILHLHGEALVGGIEARPLGHGPALEGALQLQAEIVVETAGRVLLDHEGQIRRAASARARGLARRLGGGLEVPLAAVLAKPHSFDLSTVDASRPPEGGSAAGRGGNPGKAGAGRASASRGRCIFVEPAPSRTNSSPSRRSRAWLKAPSSFVVSKAWSRQKPGSAISTALAAASPIAATTSRISRARQPSRKSRICSGWATCPTGRSSIASWGSWPRLGPFPLSS